MLIARCLIWIILLSVGFVTNVLAVSTAQIPDKPNAPQVLAPTTVPPDVFQCERHFIYQGKTLDCDSNTRRDGEKLRPYFAHNPEAISELNLYQKGRSAAMTSAYVSGFGLVIGIAGYLITRGMNNPDGTITATGDLIRSITTVGGISLMGGSFIFGLALLSFNESHLQNAINLHNKAQPENPIQLQFSKHF